MGNNQLKRHKHIPQRTCIACRQKTDKRLLTRLVRTIDEGVVVDPTGKRNGRGAYVCAQSTCWDKILDTALLNQVLATNVTEVEKEVIRQFRK